MPSGVYKRKFKYIPGMKLGPYNILLLERVEKRKNGNWVGKFECPHCVEHTTFQAIISNVVNGHTSSCGCLARKTKVENGKKTLKYNLVGQTFGYLKVLKDTGKRTNNGRPIWLCRCILDNNIVEYNTEQIQRGKISCGCLETKKSNGEILIESILKENNIIFFKECIFKNCRNPKTNRCLRFDFYLPDYNCCIEYDGKQHFIEKDTWSEKESLATIQYRDYIKEQYCSENGIRLIRILYTDYDKINKQYLMELIND